MIKFGKCGCICNSWLGECMVRSQKYLGPRIPYFKHECNSFGCAIYCWCQMSRLNHFKIDTDKNLSTDSKAKFKHVTDKYAGPSGRAVLGVGLQQLACWECWRCGSTAARLLRMLVWIPPGACMSVYCEGCLLSSRGSLRRADHASRGVLPTVARRCVWSRNLKNNEAMAGVGPHRHRGEKTDK